MGPAGQNAFPHCIRVKRYYTLKRNAYQSRCSTASPAEGGKAVFRSIGPTGQNAFPHCIRVKRYYI
jgi:hypothetical protein